MLPLIYTNPAAIGLFIIACLIWLVPEMIVMPRQIAKVAVKAGSNQDRGSLIVLLGLQWAGLALNFSLALIFPSAAIPWQRAALFLIGIVLIILGVALRWYAIRTLGHSFTPDVAVFADQQIIQDGVYRLIRHPAYSGTLLTMLGVGLVTTNWASLIILLVCVFSGHFCRVKVEEKALINTLGQPYIEYMRRTRRFIPMLF